MQVTEENKINFDLSTLTLEELIEEDIVRYEDIYGRVQKTSLFVINFTFENLERTVYLLN